MTQVRYSSIAACKGIVMTTFGGNSNLISSVMKMWNLTEK